MDPVLLRRIQEQLAKELAGAPALEVHIRCLRGSAPGVLQICGCSRQPNSCSVLIPWYMFPARVPSESAAGGANKYSTGACQVAGRWTPSPLAPATPNSAARRPWEPTPPRAAPAPLPRTPRAGGTGRPDMGRRRCPRPPSNRRRRARNAACAAATTPESGAPAALSAIFKPAKEGPQRRVCGHDRARLGPHCKTGRGRESDTGAAPSGRHVGRKHNVLEPDLQAWPVAAKLPRNCRRVRIASAGAWTSSSFVALPSRDPSRLLDSSQEWRRSSRNEGC